MKNVRQKLMIEIDAVNRAKRVIKDVQNQIKKFGEVSKRVTSFVKKHWLSITAAVAAFVGVMKKATDAAIEQERAEQRLAFALKKTGANMRALMKDYKDYASSLQKVSTFGDEAIIVIEAQFQAMGYNADMVKKLTKLTLDWATVSRKDLKPAMEDIGGALKGRADLMKKYGIEIEKTKVETEGASYVIEQMSKVIGGAAENELKTFGGAITQLKNYIGDLFEAIGFLITKNEKFVEGIRKASKAISEFVNELMYWESNEFKLNKQLLEKEKRLEELREELKRPGNIRGHKLLGFYSIDKEEIKKQIKILENEIDDLQKRLNKEYKAGILTKIATGTNKKGELSKEAKNALKNTRKEMERFLDQIYLNSLDKYDRLSEDYLRGLDRLIDYEKKINVDLTDYKLELQRQYHKELLKMIDEEKESVKEELSWWQKLIKSHQEQAKGGANILKGTTFTQALAAYGGDIGASISFALEFAANMENMIKDFFKSIKDAIWGAIKGVGWLFKNIFTFGGLFGGGGYPSLAETFHKLSGELNNLIDAIKNVTTEYKKQFMTQREYIDFMREKLEGYFGKYGKFSYYSIERPPYVNYNPWENPNPEAVKRYLEQANKSVDEFWKDLQEYYRAASAYIKDVADKHRKIHLERIQQLEDEKNKIQELTDAVVNQITDLIRTIKYGTLTPAARKSALRAEYLAATTPSARSAAAQRYASAIMAEWEAWQKLAAEGAITNAELQRHQNLAIDELEKLQGDLVDKNQQQIDILNEQLKAELDIVSRIDYWEKQQLEQLRRDTDQLINALRQVQSTLEKGMLWFGGEMGFNNPPNFEWQLPPKNAGKYNKDLPWQLQEYIRSHLPHKEEKGQRQLGGAINQSGLYYLHSGEYVIPKTGMGAGGGVNLVINVSGAGNPRAVANEIFDIFKEKMRLNERGLKSFVRRQVLV